ncbi:3-oxoacyl-ACP reductase FabG [Candidatus Solirubrobacter pratensis]|uniref:3-oxoacyl-ACP reductase FabG n=1 Tax=Candidatus Solirubrobacter pratensis TaxID=1298857 RepID=UPI000414904B|nr:3-oxoacyl-ACP reductase FabG [Candidatus Solirubrobacter pratensis]
MRRLDGQGAIVTGSARGIGRGIAQVLASEGARVAIADLNQAAAEATAAEFRDAGHDAIAVGVDVTSRESVGDMAAAVLDAFGHLDILAANAGIYPIALIDQIDEREWDRVNDLNAKGAFFALQACVPAMRARSYGRIVLTSSITGPITGHPGYAHYGASKAAMLGFMRSAAIELATDGVTVNAVMPGNVRTPGLDEAGEEHQRQMMASIPLKDFADPEDIGWAVRFLASPEARYITGQTLIVDGGQVLPETPEAL